MGFALGSKPQAQPMEREIALDAWKVVQYAYE
jgi:hypothetical protein